MKKILLVFINILVLFILYFIFKWISIYIAIFPEYPNFGERIKAVCTFTMQYSYKKVYFSVLFRPTENENQPLPPVLILGCSYAAGIGSSPELKNNETFSYYLSEKIKNKRPVYNRAIGSQGLQAAIWQFTDGKIFKEIKNEPEYIIYVLISDQIRRLYMECSPWNKTAFYRDKENSIEVIKNPFYYSYFMNKYREKFVWLNSNLTTDKKLDFLRKHFVYLKKESDKKWKNSKWIILYYNDDKRFDYNIKDFENEGFKVIKLSDIVSEDFFTDKRNKSSDTNIHPTKYAWETVADALYRKMNEIYGLE